MGPGRPRRRRGTRSWLSQLLGGWTKWGYRDSRSPVLVTAFVPVAIVSLWVVLAGEPGSGWFHDHVLAWTRDIHLSGLVTDFLYYIPVLAFGTGLVFGFSFDTAGPRVRDRDAVVDRDRDVVQDNGRAAGRAADGRPGSHDYDHDRPVRQTARTVR